MHLYFLIVEMLVTATPPGRDAKLESLEAVHFERII